MSVSALSLLKLGEIALSDRFWSALLALFAIGWIIFIIAELIYGEDK